MDTIKENAISTLYHDLGESGYGNLGTFDEFVDKCKSKTNRKALYNASVKSLGANIGADDFSEFVLNSYDDNMKEREEIAKQQRMEILPTYEKQLNEMGVQNKARQKELSAEIYFKKDYSKSFLDIMAEARSGGNYNINPENDDTRAMDKLGAESRVIKDTRNAIEDIKHGQGNTGFKNAMIGLGDGLTDIRTWDNVGLVDMQDSQVKYNLYEKQKEGKELTPDETRMLTTLSLQDMINREYTNDMSMGRQIGAGAAGSIQFMASSISGSHITGAIKLGTRLATKALIKGGGKLATKKFLTKAITTTGKVFDAGVKGSLMSASYGGGTTIADTNDRATAIPLYETNPDGVKFIGSKDGLDFGTSLQQSFLANGISYTTEGLGALFPTGLLNKTLKSLGGKKIGDVAKGIKGSKAYAVASEIQQRAGLQSIPAEYTEENLELVLNAMFVGDSQYSDLLDLKQQLITLGTVSLISGPISLAKGVGYRSPKSVAKKELGTFDTALSSNINFSEQWGALKQQLTDAKSIEQRADVYLEAMDGIKGNGIRNAVQSYTNTLNFIDGYNEHASSEDLSSIEKFNLSISDSFTVGINTITPNEIAKIKEEYNDVKKLFKADEIEDLEKVVSPHRYMSAKGDQKNKDKLYSFFKSRAKIKGLEAQQTDKVQGRFEQLRAVLDAKTAFKGSTQEKSNYIYPITLIRDEKAEYYVLTGNVIVDTENQRIDLQKSSTSLTIVDGNGKAEMIPIQEVRKLKGIIDVREELTLGLAKIEKEVAQEHSISAETEFSHEESAQSKPQVVQGYVKGQELVVSGKNATFGEYLSDGKVLVRFEEPVSIDGGPAQSVLAITPQRLRELDESSQPVLENTQIPAINPQGEVNNVANPLVEVSKGVEQVEPTIPVEAEVQPIEVVDPFPRDKDGDVEYDKIDGAELFSSALVMDFGDDPNDIVALLKGYIERDTKEIKQTLKNKNLAKAKTKAKRIIQRISMYQSVLEKFSPAQNPTQSVSFQEPSEVKTLVSADIQTNWKDAKKDFGVDDIVTTPSGEQIKGRWVLTEATSVVPSHDPHTLQPSIGFPTAENGGTINDNDYTGKRTEVETMANAFDSRAIDNPIIVQDGAILSGNNRTMSSILSAERGTDGLYLDALSQKAEQRGFTTEQLSSYQHPRLVFEVSGQPLTTQTFAKFNARETKAKSPVEKAIVSGKILKPTQFNQIASVLDGYENMGEFYSSFNSQKQVLTTLLNSGVVTPNDIAEIYDDNGFTTYGKSYVESVMLGGVVEEKQLRLLNNDGMRQFRTKIVKSTIPLLQARALDSSVISDINTAISYLYDARTQHDGNLANMVVQLDLFDTDKKYDIDAMTMSIILSKKEREFKEFAIYLNETLKNQGTNLLGETINKQTAYNEYRDNKFTDEQQRIVRAVQGADTATNPQTTGIPSDRATHDGRAGTKVDNGNVSGYQDSVNSGKDNKIFTHDQYLKDREALRKKLNNLNVGVDPEVIFLGIKMAGYHIERGVRKFPIYAKAMVDDFGEKIIPYLKPFYNGLRDMPEISELSDSMDNYQTVSQFDINTLKNTNNNATSTTIHSQRDSEIPNENPINEATVSTIGRRNTRSGGEANRQLGGDDNGGPTSVKQNINSDKASGEPTSTTGAQGILGLHLENQPDITSPSVSRDIVNKRNDDTNPNGQTTSRRVETTGNTQTGGTTAERVEIANIDNIRTSLPQLFTEQQDDVLFAEKRFFTNPEIGKGVLFTNGTGTGKTYTGLGIIKRFTLMGKDNIIIVVPTDKKAEDWIEDAKNLDLTVTQLSGVQDAGKGIVVTTYANYQQNRALEDRNLDLIVYDESHYLGQGQHGIAQKRFDAHSIHAKLPIVTRIRVNKDYEDSKPRHPQGDHDKSLMEQYRNDYSQWENSVQAELERRVNSVNTVLLSATPFAYHKTLQYADGLLFEISQTTTPNEGGGNGYNVATGFDQFMTSNFGYRMRYNKLTRPESGVDIDLMERAFYEKMHDSGIVSGRQLDIPQDYSRNFVLVDSEIGRKINEGMDMFYDHKEGGFKERYPLLSEYAPKKHWNYLYINQLLETIKASQSISRIEEHLSLGRKVVLFHSYNNALPGHPFHFFVNKLIPFFPSKDISETDLIKKRIDIEKEINSFNSEYKKYANLDLGELQNTRVLLNEKFGSRLKEFNGTVPKKARRENIKSFNTSNSGVDILLVQRQAGKEGISLHDTKGENQRVLIDLGLPTAPTDAIQTEGRIYRLYTQSDAIIEYPVIKTNFEIYAYSSKIAERVRTPENLAMGNLARDLENAFREGYNNADYLPVSEMNGIGGKQSDKTQNILTDFDRAKTYYFARQKKTSKNKSREGTDYFATPEPIGFKMVEWLSLQPNEDVLEPSAGHGAIARFLNSFTNNKFIEPSYNLATELKVNTKGEVLQHSFEDYYIGNKFDAVAMNPPYGTNSKTAMEHLEKAYNHLRSNGRVIAIVPSGASMQKRLDKFLYGTNDKNNKPLNPEAELIAEIMLPSVTFNRAGTSVSTKIVIIDKISDKSLLSNHYTQKIDLTSHEDVGKLFDAIESLSIADRFGRADVVEEVSIPTTQKESISQNISDIADSDIIQIEHTQTKEPLYTVSLSDRVSKEDYKKTSSLAKVYGGYWSRFTKSFIFKTREDAERFNVARKDSDIRYRSNNNNNNNKNLSNINNTFNQQLQKQIDGTLSKGHIYKLGTPNEILLSSGIPNLDIELSADKLLLKSSDGYVNSHPFKLSDVKNLPFAIQNPVAIFNSKSRDDSKVILTELQSNGVNFIVALQINRRAGKISVNSIRSIYPKDYVKDIVDWINRDLLLFSNKEKTIDFLTNSSNPADVIKETNSSKSTLGNVLVQSTFSTGNGHNTKGFDTKVEKNTEDAKRKIENFTNPTIFQGEKLSRIEELTEKIGVSVRAVNSLSAEDAKGRKRGTKGWYDTKTGDVTIVLDNNLSPEDCVQTYLHEVVGHKGLRYLLGKEFDTFLDNVYNGVSAKTRSEIDAKSTGQRESTEEYISELAERGFAKREDNSTWQKIKNYLLDAISHAKLGLGFRITDNDLRYMLWRSYNNLSQNRDIFKRIDHSALRHKLRVDESSLLYRGMDQIDSDKTRTLYEQKVATTMYKFDEGWRDYMLSLRVIQDIIEKANGRKLSDFEDAYMAENAKSSCNLAESELLHRTKIADMFNVIARLQQKGDTYEAISDYLYCKTGIERNEYMAREQARQDTELQRLEVDQDTSLSEEQKTVAIRDIKQHETDLYKSYILTDYSGLTEVTLNYNSNGSFTDRANQFISTYESKRPTETTELWKTINAISSFSLKKAFSSGLMTNATYQDLTNRHKYYMPLRGWDKDIASDVYEYLDSVLPVVNPIMKFAKGRTSRANDPVATLINMADSAIAQGNKNAVKRKFYNMVVNNPSNLFTVSQSWYVLNSDGKYEVKTPDITKDTTQEELATIVDKFEEEMQKLKANGLAYTRKSKPNLPYITMSYQLSEHAIPVLINGTEYHIYVNGNPVLAQAMNGKTNPEQYDSKIAKGVEKVNRFMSANFTSRNPDFVLRNLSRDFFFSNANLFVKESGKYQRTYLNNYRKNFIDIVPLMVAYLNGKLDPANNPKHKLFEEFIMNGGETGYTNLLNVEQIKKAMSKEISRVKDKKQFYQLAFGTVRSVAKFIENTNRCVEDISRFSTYETSRSLGRSIPQSIYDAKEVSVNFNKKGRGTKGNKVARLLYLFLNPAIQGLTAIKKAHDISKVRFYGTASAYTALGMLMPVLNGIALEMWGDEEDKNAYYSLPDYIRKNNIVMRVGDKFVTLPLSHELRTLYGLGEMFTSYLNGEMDDKNIAMEALYHASNMLPINPLGENVSSIRDVGTKLMPDVLKPLVYVINNKDFFGTPIYKDSFNENMPEYTKSYNSTNKLLVKGTEWLNNISGGDKYTKGAIDINPAIVEHFGDSYLGGVAKFVNKVAKTVTDGFDADKKVQLRNIPIVSSFLQETDDRTLNFRLNEKYYNLRDEMAKITQRLNGYEKEAKKGSINYGEKLIVLRNSIDFKRRETFKYYEKMIKELNGRLKQGEDKKLMETSIIYYKLELLEQLEQLENQKNNHGREKRKDWWQSKGNTQQSHR